MNIIETYEFLDNLAMFSRKNGLEALKQLMDKLGNPHKNLKVVHVAGTNGKGSTATMVANILIEAGYKTGLFISPFVLEFRERIQLNNLMISEPDLCTCAEKVREKMGTVEYGYFEVVTAIAFLYYQMKNCDIVILEVGLGGRLDSTNIIEGTLVNVITLIGMDHVAILGDTIEKIAWEKAGIIKGGTTVIYPLMNGVAEKVIQAKCEQTGSNLIIPDLKKLVIEDDKFFRRFTYKNMIFNKKLLGKFQIYNAMCAIEVAINLREYGYKITDMAIENGVNETFFPARIEVLEEEPLTILDGAHNYDGSMALASVIKTLAKDRINILIGTLRTKDHEEMMKVLLPLATNTLIVRPNNKKAEKLEKLKETAQKYCPNVYEFDDYKGAVAFGQELTKKNDVFIICGSLYLASDVRKLFKSN